MKGCLGCIIGQEERLGHMTQESNSLSQIWSVFLASCLGFSIANPSRIWFERKFLISLPNSSQCLLFPWLLTISLSCLSIILVTWVLPGCYLKSLSVLTSRLCKTLPHSLSKIQPFLSIHATEILVQGLSCHLTSQTQAAFLTLIHSESFYGIQFCQPATLTIASLSL